MGLKVFYEFIELCSNLDRGQPVVDRREGRVVRHVVGEWIVHRTFRDLLERFRTANLKS